MMKLFAFGLMFVFIANWSSAQLISAADNSAPSASTAAAPTGQAPHDVITRLSSLIHDGKYADAEQLTKALSVAYPTDERLIKVQALLDKVTLPSQQTAASATPSETGLASTEASSPPAAPVPSRFGGMDKVDYSALIELARQAQQASDPEQQKTILRKFMTDSGPFLQKYPDTTLLWQIRGESALTLDDAKAGYEAGQKLLALGVADKGDAAARQLLANLKIKGWLDKPAEAVAPPVPATGFYVTGEVKNPGKKPYLNGETLQDAIEAGGGFTDYAKLQEIIIQDADGHQVERNRTIGSRALVRKSDGHGKMSVNYTGEFDLPIYPNDCITVMRRW